MWEGPLVADYGISGDSACGHRAGPNTHIYGHLAVYQAGPSSSSSLLGLLGWCGPAMALPAILYYTDNGPDWPAHACGAVGLGWCVCVCLSVDRYLISPGEQKQCQIGRNCMRLVGGGAREASGRG